MEQKNFPNRHKKTPKKGQRQLNPSTSIKMDWCKYTTYFDTTINI